MDAHKGRKVIRLFGVGFDTDDNHVRITQGERFDVIMGSSESHEYICRLIRSIEEEMEKRALCLDQLSPGEFTRLVETLI